MRILRILPALCLVLPLGLTGCFYSTHTVPQTHPPSAYQTVTIEQLEKLISDRDAATKTLNASVLITASTGGGKEGKVTEYTSLRGYIFVRKPADLRVLMQAPVLGSRAVDMVSGGGHFTLLINTLTSSRAIVGTDKVTKSSKNGLENLRPYVFFDSLLVPGIRDDEYVTLTETTRVLQEETRRHDAIEEPDYDVTVLKGKAGKVLQRERVIHINRLDLLPFQQDIYNEEGQIVTTTTYENYRQFGDQQFATLITIRRPLDEYSLKLEITKLTLNGKLEDDQFELKLPPNIAVQKME
jgi:outer membrane lipoprotein-sorting protein